MRVVQWDGDTVHGPRCLCRYGDNSDAATASCVTAEKRVPANDRGVPTKGLAIGQP